MQPASERPVAAVRARMRWGSQAVDVEAEAAVLFVRTGERKWRSVSAQADDSAAIAYALAHYLNERGLLAQAVVGICSDHAGDLPVDVSRILRALFDRRNGGTEGPKEDARQRVVRVLEELGEVGAAIRRAYLGG